MPKLPVSITSSVLALAILFYVGCSSNGGSTIAAPPPVHPSPSSVSTTVPLVANTALPIPAIGGFAGTLTEATNNAPAGTTVTITSYSVAPNTAPAPQAITSRLHLQSVRSYAQRARAHGFASTPTAIFWVSQQYSAAATFQSFPVTMLEVPPSIGNTLLALEVFDGTTSTLLDVEFATPQLDVATFAGSDTSFSAVPGHTYWLELVSGKAEPPPEFVYVANNVSSNVSAYAIDQTTGGLTQVANSPFAAVAGLWGITTDPSGRFVYAVGNYVTNQPSVVSGYGIDSANGALTQVPGSPFISDHGCGYPAVDPSSKFAYVSCWDNSKLAEYTIDANGTLTFIGLIHTISGSGPGASQVVVDPSDRFVYVPNNTSGSGSVSGYTIDSATGALTAIPGSPFPAGSTDVIAAVDPTGRYLYSTDNVSNDILAFAIDQTTGALSPVVGSPFAAGTDPIGIAIDPTGKFVYVADINSNDVIAYTIDSSTGALTLVGTFPTGTQPFNVAIEPLGKFAYVTNQADDTVSAFAINAVSGALTPVGTYATGLNPIGIAAGRVAAGSLR